MKTAFDAARAYLAKLPPAISGAHGHDATFTAACWAVRFGLADADAMILLKEYNRRCVPPWTEKELGHKLQDARRVAGGHCPQRRQPKQAERVIWKLERKAAGAKETASIEPPSSPAVAQALHLPAATEPAARFRTDCMPWVHVARQVLAGEFDYADRSMAESLSIGLRSIAHPLCRQAMERLHDLGK